MADKTDATAPCHWVAIDVARYWNAVLIETASGQRHRFRMANAAEDFDRLIEFLNGLGGRVRAALEPTGDYHRAIAHRLAISGAEVVSISSVAQSRFREAMFNSWDKNDPKDATVILEMLKQGRVQRYVDPMLAGHHDLQELSKTYYQVSRARTKVQHAIINHHVPLYFVGPAKFSLPPPRPAPTARAMATASPIRREATATLPTTTRKKAARCVRGRPPAAANAGCSPPRIAPHAAHRPGSLPTSTGSSGDRPSGARSQARLPGDASATVVAGPSST